mmetsp:Transcript_4637/g.10194  ORF Transcript_4637/g.10194 Transcript_4637/m.10194 type:complete len:256 (+) Transcript_4637:520-1287(+)
MKVSSVTMEWMLVQEQETAAPSRLVSQRRTCHQSSLGSSDHWAGRTSAQPSSSEAQREARERNSCAGDVSRWTSLAARVHTASISSPAMLVLTETLCTSARDPLFCRCSTVSPPPGDRTAAPLTARVEPLLCAEPGALPTSGSPPKTMRCKRSTSPSKSPLDSENARGVALRDTSASDDDGRHRTSRHSTSYPPPPPPPPWFLTERLTPSAKENENSPPAAAPARTIAPTGAPPPSTCSPSAISSFTAVIPRRAA